ncbi:MAG: hypothetical protein R3C68_06135 [Myxococcota bacterium]
MELRAPPIAQRIPCDPWLPRIAVLLVLVLVAIGALIYSSHVETAQDSQPKRLRELASKLKTAGALEQSALMYERYMQHSSVADATRAKIAYSVGQMYLDAGRHNEALRWFYEAESYNTGLMQEALGKKIVHSLESLGRFHAAQAALQSHVGLNESPEVQHPKEDEVVARIGKDDIYRSDVTRALDDLPVQMQKAFTDNAGKADFLHKYVADELLWRKAQRLEYDTKPEVRRQLQAVLKQLVISRFINDEVLGKINPDASDVQTFYNANLQRYGAKDADGKHPNKPKPFEDVKQQVEQDYRSYKFQEAYRRLIDEELATQDVEFLAAPEKKAP